MSKKISTAICSFFLLFGISGIANASWTCDSNGQAMCYVEYVELYTPDSTSTDTYVLAKISTTMTSVTCNTVLVRKGTANATVQTVKMAETILMTALTTRLPIKFEVISGTTTCYLDNLAIQKPTN